MQNYIIRLITTNIIISFLVYYFPNFLHLQIAWHIVLPEVWCVCSQINF